MQRQRVAQRSKAQVSGTFRQVGKYRQGIGVDGKLFVKRVFQRCKDMEAGIIRVYREGKDVFDQRCVIMPGGHWNSTYVPKRKDSVMGVSSLCYS